MTKTTWAALVAAAAAALVAGGIYLQPGEAVDLEASWRDDAGKRVQGVIRCAGLDDGGLDCGDPPGDDTRLHLDTRSAPYSTTEPPGHTNARHSQCACGPILKPNQCRVQDPLGGGLRESRPGEYLAAGTWSGACVPRPCWELAEVAGEVGGVGYSMPLECGGAVPADAGVVPP